jgi:CubicO group peptidase (beta-lactamase class C family)
MRPVSDSASGSRCCEIQPRQRRRSRPGTWRWGGAYGHSWFVDRALGLSVVAFTNTLYEGMSGRFVTELRNAVYGALEVGR